MIAPRKLWPLCTISFARIIRPGLGGLIPHVSCITLRTQAHKTSKTSASNQGFLRNQPVLRHGRCGSAKAPAHDPANLPPVQQRSSARQDAISAHRSRSKAPVKHRLSAICSHLRDGNTALQRTTRPCPQVQPPPFRRCSEDIFIRTNCSAPISQTTWQYPVCTFYTAVFICFHKATGRIRHPYHRYSRTNHGAKSHHL